MSLVETLISMALTLVLSATILSLVSAAQTIARTQPESADVQQRARIAVRTLAGELRDAGAGLDRGPMAGPLVRRFPPIAPSSDGGVTIWTATNRDAQAAPAVIIALGATSIPLQDAGTCPAGQAACAFTAGTSAIAFTADGCRTTVRVAGTDRDTLLLAAPLAGCTLDMTSAIAEGDVRTYRLDAAARQLLRRDEATGSSAPLLDGVTGLSLSYFADAAATNPIGGTADADLMRTRLVRVSLRFAAVNTALRIPDFAIAFDVVPRNGED